MCLPSTASHFREVNIFTERCSSIRHVQYPDLDEILLNLQLAFKINPCNPSGALIVMSGGYIGDCFMGKKFHKCSAHCKRFYGVFLQ